MRFWMLFEQRIDMRFFVGERGAFKWEASDLFQFYYDTTPIIGSLDELKPLLDGAAIDKAIKIGVCNVYHGCVHNMLHEKSMEILKGLYKSASFIVQAIAFKQSGRYIKHQKSLLGVVRHDEKAIVETFCDLKTEKLSILKKHRRSYLSGRKSRSWKRDRSAKQ